MADLAKAKRLGSLSDVSPVVDLLASIRRQRFMFWLIVAAVGLTSISITLLLPRSYTATATVYVVPLAADPLQPNRKEDGVLADDEVTTQALLLGSRDLATAVLNQLGIELIPRQSIFSQAECLISRWFYPSCSAGTDDATYLNKQVEALQKRLTVFPMPRSRVIELTYTDGNPDRAARILNFLVTSFQQEQTALHSADLGRTTAWLSERAEVLRRNLEDAERKVAEFRSQSGLAFGDPTSAKDEARPLIEKLIDNTAQNLSNATADLATATGRKLALSTAANASDKSALLSWPQEPALLNLWNQLSQARFTLAELRGRLKDDNPSVELVKGNIARLEAQFDSERERALRSIDTDVAVKQVTVDVLQARLYTLRDQAGELSSKQVALLSLENEARTARSLYEAFITRSRELEDRAPLARSQVQFSAHASAPTNPSFPNVPAFLFGGVVFSFISGILSVKAREHMSKGFTRLSGLEEQLSLPFMSAIPKISGMKPGAAIENFTLDHPYSVQAEAIRTIAAQLQLKSTDGQPIRSVVIASSTAQEGKTTVAWWLAKSLSSGGRRVLLIDGDHRRSSVHGANQQVAKITRGFSDLVFGDATRDDVVLQEESKNLFRLSSGPAAVRPYGPRELDTLSKLMRTFEESFDMVIIDSPPLMAVSDAILYSTVAHGTIFLCRWRRTSRQAVVSCLDRLKAANAMVHGIAMTMVAGDLSWVSDEYSTYHGRAMMRDYSSR